MMAGLSARTAIQAQTGLTADLKWPNDLLVGGKKVGGILTEMHAEPTQVRFVIVGIGVNVNQEKFPGELANDGDFAAHGNGQAGFAVGIAGAVAAGIRDRLQSFFARRAERRDGTIRGGFELCAGETSAGDERDGEFCGDDGGTAAGRTAAW